MTRADEGVAPVSRGATQPATQGSVGVADLTHEMVRGNLSDYLDDSLSEALRRRIDCHLANCIACVSHLETLKATVQAVSQLPTPKAPGGVRARILGQVRHERG